MEENLKQLLLKDLCARLLYHPCINVCNDSWEGCQTGQFDTNLYSHHIDAFICDRIEVQPYLRPMSSMTEEEKEEILGELFGKASNLFYIDEEGIIDETPTDLRRQGYNSILFCPRNINTYADWLNANHFDYRGLIEKGLAIEAPEGMYRL